MMLSMLNNKLDFQNTDCEIALLPIAALEQHGSHLPVGTDILIGNEVSRRIAEKLNAYLLPAIPITCSIEHRETKGSVYIKASTLAAMISDIAESLQYSGFKKLYLYSSHGGNWVLKPTIRELNRTLPHIDVILLSSQVARSRVNEIMENSSPPDIHAGEIETSLILHLHNELVGKIKEVPNQKFYLQDYLDYYDFSEITEDGYWGYPKSGTAEKGKRWLDLLVDCAIAYINELEEVREKVSKQKDSIIPRKE